MNFTFIFFREFHMKMISHEFQLKIPCGDFACVLLKPLLRLSKVCHYVQHDEILLIKCKLIKPHAIN